MSAKALTPDEIIPPATNSIQAMIRIDPELKAVKVPEMHKQIDAAIGANNEVAAAAAKQKPLLSATTAKYGRGQLVYDKEKMIKVTVLKVNIGRTNKGTILYRVGEGRTGESWIQLETRLQELTR